MDIGHWNFPHIFSADDWFGFIYRITEIKTGREYIGKKQFHQYLKKEVKGRVNKKSVKKESNWKTYIGSSVHLKQAIETHGKEEYLFTIESLHKTRASLVYAEVRCHILEDVLRARMADGVTPKYFNRQVSGIKFIPPDEVSDETKMKISKTLIEKYSTSPHWKTALSDEDMRLLNEKYYSGKNHYLYRQMDEDSRINFINANFKGENNPMFGKISPHAGKTWEEEYGIDKANAIKQILREKCVKTGEENGMYGKNHTDEQKNKWSNDSRRQHKAEKNGMYGKSVTDFMSPEEIKQWKENISKSGKGKKRSDITRSKMSSSAKGKSKPIFTCADCNREIGGQSNFSRHIEIYCQKKNTKNN